MLFGGEQGQLHPVRCLDPGVAVAPRRYDRRCDPRGSGHDEPPRHVLAVRYLDREPDRAGHPAAGLDRVDRLGLGLVEEFELRPAGVEHDDPPGLRTPVGDLLEPEGIAVERQGLVEVLHRECDTQLSHISHGPFLANRSAITAPGPITRATAGTPRRRHRLRGSMTGLTPAAW